MHGQLNQFFYLIQINGILLLNFFPCFMPVPLIYIYIYILYFLSWFAEWFIMILNVVEWFSVTCIYIVSLPFHVDVSKWYTQPV